MDQLSLKGIVEGPNFAFGKDRLGTTELLDSWRRSAGIDFTVVEPVRIGENLVSSSLIRDLLARGDVGGAARLLTRPHRISGTVVKGAGRGAGLGFPTANLTSIPELIPAEGVYAGLARVRRKGRAFRPAAIHIGPNSTFGEAITSVEAHIIDFSGDLYGAELEIDFLERIRGSIRFDSVAELLSRIRDDVKVARMSAARRPAKP